MLTNKKHRPFLKWAGSKYRIIGRVKAELPKGKRLVEPFLGSGALFLNTDYEEYLLTDTNQDLINLYQVLQKSGLEFIDYCKSLFISDNNNQDLFYEYRDEFNQIQDVYRKSALFLYLNRHCYNGLCRYNKSDKFNVPFGSYKKPYFPLEEMRFFYKKSQKVTFRVADFADILASTKKGDVVYADPPYDMLSKTSNFTSYSSNIFGLQQQEKLAELANQLAERGIPVLISNHETENTIRIYKDAQITKFNVQRFISANGSKRGRAGELLALFA